MAYVSKGHKAMTFVDGKAIAFATNHQISVTANILTDRTKDDGDAPVGDFDNYSWGMQSDHIVGVNDAVGANEKSIVDMIDAMLGLQKVGVVSDAAVPTSGSVPASGWAEGGNAQNFPIARGEAYIESLSVSAGATGYATASVSLKGQGELGQ